MASGRRGGFRQLQARAAADLLSAAGETEHAAFWRYIEAHSRFARGRPQDLAAAREALAEATRGGPRTAWFRRLSRTVEELHGHTAPGDDTDRLFLAWDEWRPETGGRLDRIVTGGRAALVGSHDAQCEGLRILARLAGADGDRPPKGEQSATDCRWTWSTTKRGERRIWEVKTVNPNKAHSAEGPDPVDRGDINQLLGQHEVETRRYAKTEVYGCLLTPATQVTSDAAEAAHDKIAIVSHPAAGRLYDLLADGLRQYDALCGDGNAEARGTARGKIEALLPPDGWLARLFAPTHGTIIATERVEALFPSP